MRRIALVVIPIVIAAMLWHVYGTDRDEWSGFKMVLLALAAAIWAAFVLRGRLRDATMVGASLLVGLAGIEAYLVLSKSRSLDHQSAGYSVTRPVLGWGPEHPGIFHQTKLAARTRAPVFDTDYTIDSHLHRQVISAESGPAVVFVGDSMTFGTGLPDAQTLPQLFADLSGRKIGVLNLGFPGYGPQQILRAFETGLDDKLLAGRARLFVYETAAWHAERSSCAAGFMLRAPRYVMATGQPRFEGACYQHWPALPLELLANTPIYQALEPMIGGPSRADIDLYIAILARSAALARQRFDARFLVLYLRYPPAYLRKSGYDDDQIMKRLQEAGVEVVDASLTQADRPQTLLTIPGDGHPTGAANALRAAMVKRHIEETHPDLLKTGSG